MLQTQNKIILVDNNEEHLSDLSKGFFEDNISCLPIVYDVAYDSPIKGVRLAFFDLNLLDSSNESQILSTVVDALPKYIDDNNGPFALIFWTDKIDYVPKLKEYIKERSLNVPKPFLVDCIDKDECYGQPENLKKKLKEIFSNEILNAVVGYENVVIDSAAKTTNQFFSTIPSSDSWGNNDEFVENFDKIFSKIAASTLGIKHAKENPDKAVHLALTDSLNYHISSSVNGENWKTILKTLDKASNLYDISKIEGFNYSSLNNLLHIDDKLEDLSKEDRGSVIELEPEILKIYNLNFASFYDSIIPLDKDVVGKAERKAIRKMSQLVCVEISAGCDHSQKKKRIFKYIMGVLTPAINKEQIEKKRMSASSLKVIEYVGGNSENIQLWLNLNFMLGINSNDLNLKDILFGLKGELVNLIGNRYANHVSRIGITSF